MFPSNAHCLSAGGADEHAGEDKAGAGFHQAASLLHTAVTAGERLPPHQHETRAQKTAGGDPGDEVSTIGTFVILASQRQQQTVSHPFNVVPKLSTKMTSKYSLHRLNM